MTEEENNKKSIQMILYPKKKNRLSNYSETLNKSKIILNENYSGTKPDNFVPLIRKPLIKKTHRKKKFMKSDLV